MLVTYSEIVEVVKEAEVDAVLLTRIKRSLVRGATATMQVYTGLQVSATCTVVIGA